MHYLNIQQNYETCLARGHSLFANIYTQIHAHLNRSNALKITQNTKYQPGTLPIYQTKGESHTLTISTGASHNFVISTGVSQYFVLAKGVAHQCTVSTEVSFRLETFNH